MSLDFKKVTYVDGETVIGAENLNDIQDALLDLDDNKVEKEQGKGLSTNDYSDTDKSKVDTALQPSALEDYRTASDQDEIDQEQDERIDDLEQATTSATIGPAPIVTFDASAADMPLKGLTVDIEPVQDLHGYDHPWPGGGGKNLLKNMMQSQTISGITITVNGDGSFKTSGTAEANINLAIYSKRTIADLVGGNIVISGCPANGSENTYSITLYYHDSTGKTIDTAIQAETGNGLSVNVPANAADVSIALKISSGTNVSNLIWYPMLRLSSTDASYTPYSNICPITGWTGCNVLSGRFPPVTWVPDKTINASGNETDTTGGAYSSLIPVNSGILGHLFNVTTNQTRTLRIHGYNSNGEWVKEISNLQAATIGEYHLIIEITSEIKAIRISTGRFSSYDPIILGTAYPISFPTSAGTVYGGTLTINEDGTGTLVVEWAEIDIKNLEILYQSNYQRFLLKGIADYVKIPASSSVVGNIKCECFKASAALNQQVNSIGILSSGNIAIIAPSYTTVSDFINAFGDYKILYQLAVPITYTLTPSQITTLLGTNNIWADCGDVTVTYGAYLETVKRHAEVVGDSILSAIAPLEASYTASRTYAVGSYLFVGTKFYKVTAAIGSGDTINPGTNVTQTTVAAQLMELAGN